MQGVRKMCFYEEYNPSQLETFSSQARLQLTDFKFEEKFRLAVICFFSLRNFPEQQMIAPERKVSSFLEEAFSCPGSS